MTTDPNSRDPTSPIAGVLISSLLVIFFQLAVIRFYPSLLPSLAFYKNIVLLSCFLGVGLGFLSEVNHNVGWVGIRMLSLIVLLWFLNLSGVADQILAPVAEQLHIGFVAGSALKVLASTPLYLLIFFVNAGAFLPLGSLCSRFMSRFDSKTSAYGWNLLGSVLGVLIFESLNALWLGPVLWFVIGYSLLLFVSDSSFDTRARICGALVGICLVASLPVDPSKKIIFSPYQAISMVFHSDSEIEIASNGLYFQKLWNFGKFEKMPSDRLNNIKAHYDLPYNMHGAPKKVLIVGSGGGNDVAAALRAGAQRVIAVEIDPVILELGKNLHSERPYSDSRVTAVTADARHFIKHSQETYDSIVFALLDSHTALSGLAGGLRLDSYVYTIESFREARKRLARDGTLTLSFVHMSPEFVRKLFDMLSVAFDGRPPRVINSGYDDSITFTISEDQTKAPFGSEFDITTRVLNTPSADNMSTDDWPFLYMTKKLFPSSYVLLLCLMLLISYIWIRKGARLQLSEIDSASFFLGTGFMLLETKAITELCLVYGSVQLVTSITILGVLLAAGLANLVARFLNNSYFSVICALLLLSVLLSYWMSYSEFAEFRLLDYVVAPARLVLPIFFGGLLFSILLMRTDRTIGRIFASNLFGAMLGGALEYNAMIYGYSFLYFLVFFAYGVACLSTILKR